MRVTTDTKASQGFNRTTILQHFVREGLDSEGGTPDAACEQSWYSMVNNLWKGWVTVAKGRDGVEGRDKTQDTTSSELGSERGVMS